MSSSPFTLPQAIQKVDQSILIEDGCYHFSIDDVLQSLIEVTDRNIPLFEHPAFAFLKEIHDRFGTCVALYLFYEKEIDNKKRFLSEVRSLKDELASSGDWLYFAPHALNFDTMPFEQSKEELEELYESIYSEIARITGGTKNNARIVRLHFYSEMYELGGFFANHGVAALFSTDKPVGCHRMPKEIGQQLLSSGSASYQGTNFIRTQFRAEFFTTERLHADEIKKRFTEARAAYGYVVLYTHEYELVRSEVRSMLRTCFEAFDDLSIKSVEHV